MMSWVEKNNQVGRSRAPRSVAKMPAEHPWSHSEGPGFEAQRRLLAPASCDCRFWGAAVIALALGSPSPTWETWIGFLILAFCSFQSQQVWTSGEWASACKLSICLSASQVKKIKWIFNKYIFKKPTHQGVCKTYGKYLIDLRLSTDSVSSVRIIMMIADWLVC